jgi:hypothetical protein
MPKGVEEFINLLQELTETEESFSRKIDQAYDSLQATSNLIERLETELTIKLQHLSKLKEDYERYAELAQVEEEKARALLKQLELNLNKGKGSERWMAFLINIVAGLIVFVIGVAVGPWVQSLLGL